MPHPGRRAEHDARPGLCFGIGLRRPHFEGLLEDPPLPGVDFFEVVPENFLAFGGLSRRVLRAVHQRVPIVSHGISLNLGGTDPLDQAYLEDLRDFLDEYAVPWHSDHVCISGAHGVEYHDLLPLPLTHRRLDAMASRIHAAQQALGRPMLVENPTIYTQLPGDELSEPEFLEGLVRKSGCRLLLDLNNLWVNTRNHGGDPVAYLEALPPDCVGQYHLAGHRDGEDLVIDSHASEVSPEVMDLYSMALRIQGSAWTVLERDDEIPPLELLLDELARVRATASRALREGVSWSVPRSDRPLPDHLPGDPELGVQTLHQVVIGDLDAEEAAASLGVPPAGLRVYRNFFRRHHRTILETSYQVLFSILPENFGEELIQQYQRAHPMSHREINANSAPFPSWLAEYLAGQASTPLGEFHVELALVERSRFEAYSDLQEIPTSGLVEPALNPTLSVLRLQYPVADFLEQWSEARRAGESPPAVPTQPAPEPEIVFVLRDPRTLHARLVRGTPHLLVVVKMLHEGLSIDAAVAQIPHGRGFIEDALKLAAETGVALLPSTP